MLSHISTFELVVVLMLAVLWGFLGYNLSEQARRTTGRTPWGMPSLLWAFLWFLSLLLGLILYGIYLITRSSAQRRSGQAWSQPPVPGGSVTGPPQVAARRQPDPGSNFPAYPRPANSGPTTGSGDGVPHLPPPHLPPPPMPPAAGPSAPTVPPEGGAAPGTGAGGGPVLSPPAWHPDPSGRFHFRWWNGSEWTSQVSIDGQHLIDTNPDQRIGPY